MTIFDFGGPLSFGAAADVGHQVRERVKDKAAALILDFSRVPFVDVSAARAVETIICDAKRAGKIVYETGMNEEVRDTLAGLNATQCLPVDTRYPTRLDALRAAVEQIVAKDSANGSEGSLPAASASA